MTKGIYLFFVLVTTSLPRCVSFSIANPTKVTNVNFEDWIADAPAEVTEWNELTVNGEIPRYVHGTWIRNGGGIWSSSKDDTYSHFFDGLAKISAYRVNGGRVCHQARFLRGKWYNKFVLEGKLPPGLGTGPILDAAEKPKLGLMRIAEAIFNVVTSFDNAPVNIWDYDPLLRSNQQKKVVALTDAPCRVSVNYETMDTLGSTTINPLAKGSKGFELLTTSHPLYSFDNDDTYNIAAELGIPNARVNLIKETALGERSVVGSFDMSDGSPYFHSFGLSRNYAVIVVQPFRLDLDASNLMEKGLYRAMKHVSGTRIVVINLKTGKCALDQTLQELLYFYHTISTCELEDAVISLRLCAYRTPDFFTGEHQFLRLEQGRRGKEWRNKLDKGGQFCDVVCNLNCNSVDIEWNHSIQQHFELPITRYSRAHGGSQLLAPIDAHPRYVYSFGSYALGSEEYDSWGLFKFDTKTWEIAAYYKEDSVYMSEPSFIPDPEGTNEDDGVLLSQAYFGTQQETKLLVLDARTMKVVAEVGIGMRTPMDLHGAWIPDGN
mmetsp:Transcript_34830/g.51145  ORF Transcript_34830/g.51145 Transcript_34830/m.51145 type:complete len:548 (-) Transcript_34830:86-1729(-)|eukprot:CAMPEP_0195519416 /NCGR_PEP_ID=MMETSP0794_2-20130614/14709_1 /TAXON_ID=515487 /ORGANISM="Stephanopyxis turris, Strain CCMP 815" /LENGTH=547 /DNA_ID=CAMNT_0040648567 /DNA_START=67 /DNA_END=1710 /DNA_ORIENTATION=+